MMLLAPIAAYSGSDRLAGDSDHKENKIEQCNIKDERDILKGDGVDSVWMKPWEKNTVNKTRVGVVLNKLDIHSSSMVSKVKSNF